MIISFNGQAPGTGAARMWVAKLQPENAKEARKKFSFTLCLATQQVPGIILWN